jgi:peptidoglycan/LPS O-acetylase OafA/YrhL
MTSVSSSYRQPAPDVLRGLAALVVVLHHFLLIFYPALFTTQSDHAHTTGTTEAQHAYSLFSFLWNGHFAVSIFFVLSGYVLSCGYFSRGDAALPARAALQRYPRLILPVVVSVLLAWLLLRMNAFSNISVAQIYTKNDFWFSNLWRIQPDLLDALKEAFVQTPFHGGTLEYNPVLWTLNIELFGSLLVFALLALTGTLRNRIIIYALLSVLLYQSHMVAFVVGTALADYRYSKYFRKLNRCLLFAFVAAAVYAGSFHWMRFLPEGEWGVLSHMTGLIARLIWIAGAALLLLCVINPVKTGSSRALRAGQWLGKISFGLYLLHLLCIGTFSCWLFPKLYDLHIGYHWSAALTLLCTLAALLPLSYIFWRFIDQPSIRFARYAAQTVFHQKTDPGIQRNS